MANIYELYRAVAMNHALADVGDADARIWADRARDRFRRDSLLCAEYNNELAGGKWRGMMIQKHIGYRSWNDNFPKDQLPALREPAAVGSAEGEQQAKTKNLFADTDRRGYLAIEAEHFSQATAPEGTQWTVYPDMGRTKSGVALTPYSKAPDGAALTYRFLLPDTVSALRVHIIVKSTLDFQARGGHEYEVCVDDGQSERVNFNARLNEDPQNIYSVFYPTVARRVVENTVTLTLPQPTVNAQNGQTEHALSLRPLAHH